MTPTHQQHEQAEHRESTLTTRLRQRPAFDPRKVLKVRPRDLRVRFIVGGLTSTVSGATTLVFGPRVGGIFLAFLRSWGRASR